MISVIVEKDKLKINTEGAPDQLFFEVAAALKIVIRDAKESGMSKDTINLFIKAAENYALGKYSD